MVVFWVGSAQPGEPGIWGGSFLFFISATWAHCPSTVEAAAGHQMHGFSTMLVSATWCLSETSCWDREERRVSVGELVPPFGLVSPPKGEFWKLNKFVGRKLSHEGQFTYLPPNSTCSSNRGWWRGSWLRRKLSWAACLLTLAGGGRNCKVWMFIHVWFLFQLLTASAPSELWEQIRMSSRRG